jgi:hypothetical protein
MITSETSDTIILGKQRVQIVIRAAEAASLRGYTLIGVGLSEFAFFEWREFMQGNDTELIRAIEPGLLTSGGPLIMCSSPWCAEGAFYDICTKGWGDDGPDDTLVVHGASFDLNPTLLSDPEQRAALAAQELADPIAYRSEIMAEWRDARSSYLERDFLMGLVDHNFKFWPPELNRCNYTAAFDPASGIAAKNGDSSACAITYYDRSRGKIVVANTLHIAPPFDALQTVRQVAEFVNPITFTASTATGALPAFANPPFIGAA